MCSQFRDDIREIRVFMEDPDACDSGWVALEMAAQMIREAEEREKIRVSCQGVLKVGDSVVDCGRSRQHDGPHSDGTTVWFGDRYPTWDPL